LDALEDRWRGRPGWEEASKHTMKSGNKGRKAVWVVDSLGNIKEYPTIGAVCDDLKVGFATVNSRIKDGRIHKGYKFEKLKKK